MSSQTQIALVKAMIELQKELQSVKKDQVGQEGHRKFSYANLESIWEVLQPLLVKNNLWFTQSVVTQDGKPYLESHLFHSEGAQLSSSVMIEHAGTEIKKFGGAITYYRRYAIQAIFSITCTDDKDPEKSEPINKVETKSETLTGIQIIAIKSELFNDDQRNWFANVMKERGYNSYTTIEQSKFQGIIEFIKRERPNG